MKMLVAKSSQQILRWAGRSVFSSSDQVLRVEQDFYRQYLRDGMTVFDVGANVGELTLSFSALAGQGKVHAFEAASSTFRLLTNRCQESNRHNVVLNNYAVTDHEGKVTLQVYDEKYSSWNSLARRPLADYGIDVKPVGTEMIPATTIDSYCERHGVVEIDLLKIDVEGAEYQVLLGAKRMLQDRRVRCCVFEFGQTTFDMGNHPDVIEEYITGVGYSLRNLISKDPVFPGRAIAKSAQFSMHIITPVS